MLLTAAGLDHVTERRTATLTTLRADGRPHVTPVGFTWDAERALVRVICSGTSQKARNLRRDPRAAVCSVDGRRWLTFEGHATVSDDAQRIAAAVERYARRYREPRVNPARVVVEIEVTRLLGSRDFRAV